MVRSRILRFSGPPHILEQRRLRSAAVWARLAAKLQKRANKQKAKSRTSSPVQICYPDYNRDERAKVDYINDNPATIANMYGMSDLSRNPIFGKGDYINFGFWTLLKQIQTLPKSVSLKKVRKQASENLYRKVLKDSQISDDSVVLDLGCGHGYGSRLIKRLYPNAVVVGVDSAAQIQRARSHDKYNDFNDIGLSFREGRADKLPFNDNSVTHIVSVEAAQHFPNFETFLAEARRVLQHNGRLVLTSFFALDKNGLEAVQKHIPDHEIHCSSYTVDDIKKLMAKNNLNEQGYTSVGEHVFPGLKNWLHVIGYQRQWTMLWIQLFMDHFIDYVIFNNVVEKPNSIQSDNEGTEVMAQNKNASIPEKFFKYKTMICDLSYNRRFLARSLADTSSCSQSQKSDLSGNASVRVQNYSYNASTTNNLSPVRRHG